MENIKPKEARGGTFATADIKLIKEALYAYIATQGENMPTATERQISNLLHRLGRID